MSRPAVVLLLLAACGSPTPTATPRITSTASDAGLASSAPPIDATPAPPPLIATVPTVITAGLLATNEVARRLESHAAALGACATEPVAIEVGFSITAEDAIPHVVGFGGTDPALATCVGEALGAVGDVASDDGTFVYAIISLATAEAAAALPIPPVLADDVEAMCEMHTRSGAMDLPVGERQERMATWFKATVRHPAVYRHTWEQSRGNVTDDRKAAEKKFVRAAGLKHCAIAGW